MLYIINKDDLSIKDTLQTNSDEVNLNINLTGKSTFSIMRSPNAIEGDFAIQKDKEIIYQGVVSSIKTIKEDFIYQINCNEIDDIFNRKIVLTNESLISSTGLEDFVAQTIRDNFTESTDTFLNIGYINLTVATHTKVNSTPPTEDGIYNFRTYLGNIKETYGVFLDYEFTESLNITISHKELETLDIDATVGDIITYEEVYKVDAISKVTVLSRESGTTYNFFLLADRTITTNPNDINRAKGSIEAVACDTDTEAYQKAVDTFKGNSYQHNVTLTVNKNSKLYNENDFTIGRRVVIKTADNGIYDTYITGISKKSTSSIFTVVCGNMKVTLLDKLKGVI